VKAWLKKLRANGKKLFVLSSSYNDFACASLKHILGFVFSLIVYYEFKFYELDIF